MLSGSDDGLPSRAPGVISHEFGDEIIVVVPDTNKVHALTGVSAEVWRRSAVPGGAWSNSAVSAEAVESLLELGLLVRSHDPSRRCILKRSGLVLAGAGIASIAVPMTSAAATGTAGNQGITLAPASGPRGTSVTVTGVAFYPGATYTATFNGITITPASHTTNASGGFTFTFAVPSGAANGSNTVTVTDSHNNSASATFTVPAPSVTVSPTTFPNSTGSNGGSKTFTVTASSGFLPGSTVTVTATNVTSVAPSSVVADSSGAVPPATLFTVAYPNGKYTITLTFADTAGNVATATIVVS